MITPNNHNKREWSRFAGAARSAGRHSVADLALTAAALPDGTRISTRHFDTLQSMYRAWLVFGEWPV